jgi:hypothetical protein
MGGGIKTYIAANEEHDQARTILVYVRVIPLSLPDTSSQTSVADVARRRCCGGHSHCHHNDTSGMHLDRVRRGFRLTLLS